MIMKRMARHTALAGAILVARACALARVIKTRRPSSADIIIVASRLASDILRGDNGT